MCLSFVCINCSTSIDTKHQHTDPSTARNPRSTPSHARYSPILAHHDPAHRKWHSAIAAPDHLKTHHEQQRPHLPACLALEPHHSVRGVHPGAEILAKGKARACWTVSRSLADGQTSIIGTIGPKTNNVETLKELMDTGLNIGVSQSPRWDTSLIDSANELFARFIRVPPVGH